MKNQTAQIIPGANVHWTFNNEIMLAERALARKQAAVARRAQKEIATIMGSVLYRKITGHKPVLKDVRPARGRVTSISTRLSIADLL
jgi:hypothetical protein